MKKLVLNEVETDNLELGRDYLISRVHVIDDRTVEEWFIARLSDHVDRGQHWDLGCYDDSGWEDFDWPNKVFEAPCVDALTDDV